MQGQTQRLGKEPIRKLLLNFYLPALIGVIANALYNIVDRIFIGRFIGAEALSGVSATFPIMLILAAFGMLIGVGSGVVLSLKLGQNNRKEANIVLGNNVLLVLIASILLFVFTEFSKYPMLRAFGASDATIKYAIEYISIIQYGFVFSILGFSLNNLIRSEGNARVAMISMIISSIANIALDWLFIAKLDMGISGAAYATIISMVILTIWVSAYFMSKKSAVKFSLSTFKIDINISRQVLAIGLAPFAMQLSQSLVQAVFNKQLIHFGGDLAVGVMGIVMSVVSFIIMAIIALNMAAQPIIGYNYGAKNFKRVKDTLSISIRYASYLSVFFWVMLLLFPEPIIRLFTKDSPEILEMGVNGLRIFIIALPIIGFQIIGGNYFQSIGKANTSVFLTLLRQVIFLTPLILILPKFWSLNGIWMSQPISDGLSACVAFYFIRKEWITISTLSKQ